jgi:hypothetical protein
VGGGSSLWTSPLLVGNARCAANHSYTCQGTTSFNKLRIVCCYFHVFSNSFITCDFFNPSH